MTAPRTPRLRGVFHQYAFFAALVAGAVLAVLADGFLEVFAVWVYVAALAAMFGASALYHRFPWRSAASRLRARRVDHAMIFVFIAGTYTPFALLEFEGWTQAVVLAAVVIAGAALYSLGALAYATTWPNPLPGIIGFHEVFHLLVVAAAATQFVAGSLRVVLPPG